MSRNRSSASAARAPQPRRVRPRPTGSTSAGLGAQVLGALAHPLAGPVDREQAEQLVSSLLRLAPPQAMSGRDRAAARDALVAEIVAAARSAPPSRSVARALGGLRLLLDDEHPASADLDTVLAAQPTAAWLPAAPLRLHRLVRTSEVRGDVRATYAVVDAEDLPVRVLGVQTDLNLGHASGLLYVDLDGLAALQVLAAEDPGVGWQEVVDPRQRARVVTETVHDLRQLRERPVAWRCLDESERQEQALLERRWSGLANLLGAAHDAAPVGAPGERARLRAAFLASPDAAGLERDLVEVTADVMLDVDERWDTGGGGRVSARKLSLLPERLGQLRDWHAEDLPDGFLSALRAWVRWCASRDGLPAAEQRLVLAVVEALEKQWDDPDELLDLLWGSAPDGPPPPVRALRQAG